MVKLKAEAKSKAFRIAKEHMSKPASHEAKQARMPIADIVASFIAKDDPKLSTSTSTRRSTRRSPARSRRATCTSSLLMSASATPTGELVRRK
ncbi:uncharacterized protein AMSG_03272 [Thecamonas trahens ATCC 50062]|uniref:Uncharacterized protein n=1 Tax=Thecamonas trahens ATCC 50062 TaxID=461836 RepID=A0A0L0D3C8_THETB|nr:hypothetical protein AMSG_03272 [Thecamonas trahens ATCC 50062]KNC46842.1 hypothetical protein AMSG_03272 [Thecamonas trahens ATCC 50062]|eukprot:XP_013760115.1 hypothetical protein AMSG_03272 [Thecamonas trahens ATCC 50062]